jgi:hypothetical protein
LFYDFHELLRSAGYDVIVIPDQDDVLGVKAYSQFKWNVVSEASIDLRVRLAIYGSADLNVGWTSGVFAPVFLSELSYLTFGVFNRASSISSESFFSRKGPTLGSQLPWASARQRIDWLEASEVTPDYMFNTTESMFLVGAV